MLSVRERLFSMEFFWLSKSGRSATSAKASEGAFTDVAALDYTNNSHSMYRITYRMCFLTYTKGGDAALMARLEQVKA